jgi:Ni/Co efflux regulator RcnB
MKTKIAALALLLLAGTAPAALAQEQNPGDRPHDHRGGDARPPGETMRDRGNAGGGRRQVAPQQAPAPAGPPPARPAPAPPQAPRGDHFQGGGRWQGPPGADGGQVQPRTGHWAGRGGENPGQGQGQGQRPDPGQPPVDRQEQRGDHHFQGGRPAQGGPDQRWGGERRPPPDNRRGEQFGDQPGDHRGDSGRWNGGGGWQGDRRNDGNRNQPRGDWSGDHDGRRQWRPGAYPRSFHSPHRYHVRSYIRPPHFYSRVWAFGEILPPAWFGPDYVIDDWWNYGLPDPPPGYDWVRVGGDALLIDQYSGRIVQVVRDLFW